MTEKNPYILERKYTPSTTGIIGQRNFPGATTKKKKKGGPPYGPVSHSFQKAFAPTPFDPGGVGNGSLVWSGINAGGVNIGSNTATGPAGPATEGILINKFTAFLESLKNEENTQLIKIIKTGFNVCFEAEDEWPKKLKKGRFTEYCKKQGFDGPCIECAKKAMKSENSSVRGMAAFYMNTVKPKGKDLKDISPKKIN